MAPSSLFFYDAKWETIGPKSSPLILKRLESITGIADEVLSGDGMPACSKQWHRLREGICTYCDRLDRLADVLCKFSIAQRLSWAASRQTTRLEDEAYCLLGLFNVNMPLLYGEGQRAFRRLQEEIIKDLDDQSILAHDVTRQGFGECPGLFAESAKVFQGLDIKSSDGTFVVGPRYRPQMALVSKWLDTDLQLCPCAVLGAEETTHWLGILNCHYGDDTLSRPALILSVVDDDNSVFSRVPYTRIERLDPTKREGDVILSTEIGPLKSESIAIISDLLSSQARFSCFASMQGRRHRSRSSSVVVDLVVQYTLISRRPGRATCIFYYRIRKRPSFPPP